MQSLYSTRNRLLSPQVVTIEPFQTDQQGCSSSLPVTYCAGEKESKPVDLLVGLEREQLLRLELAARGELEQQLALQSKHLLCIRRRHSCCSSHQQPRSHILPELLQPDGEPIGRSLPKHKSKRRQRMGCSSSDSCEAGLRFRQQLLHELAHLSRSERRRKRS